MKIILTFIGFLVCLFLMVVFFVLQIEKIEQKTNFLFERDKKIVRDIPLMIYQPKDFIEEKILADGKKVKFIYKNGLIEKEVWTDKKERKTAEVLYKDGKLSLKKWFFTNGKVQFVTKYVGRKVNREKGYFKDGKIRWEIVYGKNGKILSKKSYNLQKSLDGEFVNKTAETKEFFEDVKSY